MGVNLAGRSFLHRYGQTGFFNVSSRLERRVFVHQQADAGLYIGIRKINLLLAFRSGSHRRNNQVYFTGFYKIMCVRVDVNDVGVGADRNVMSMIIK